MAALQHKTELELAPGAHISGSDPPAEDHRTKVAKYLTLPLQQAATCQKASTLIDKLLCSPKLARSITLAVPSLSLHQKLLSDLENLEENFVVVVFSMSSLFTSKKMNQAWWTVGQRGSDTQQHTPSTKSSCVLHEAQLGSSLDMLQ